MKLLLEKWRELLNEEEQAAADKARLLSNSQREVDSLVNKVQQAAAGDDNLTREALESIVLSLQQTIEKL